MYMFFIICTLSSPQHTSGVWDVKLQQYSTTDWLTDWPLYVNFIFLTTFMEVIALSYLCWQPRSSGPLLNRPLLVVDARRTFLLYDSPENRVWVAWRPRPSRPSIVAQSIGLVSRSVAPHLLAARARCTLRERVRYSYYSSLQLGANSLAFSWMGERFCHREEYILTLYGQLEFLSGRKVASGD